jgi:dipeptidase D
MDNEQIIEQNRSVLSAYEPTIVWRHFGELAARPRPSGQEEDVRTYIIGWSEDHGFKCYRDGIGNLVVHVPGRGAGVEAQTVIIQGHLDMVTEKNSDSDHCFETDPIALRVVGDRLLASGTTLGADNGIGVAIALGAGEGLFADHPPLELLFTIDEETGMSGARELENQYLSGRRLINLDAEEEGVLYVGCAGGADSLVTGALRREPAQSGDVTIEVRLRGLKGGHSGLDIHLNRGNAIRLLSRALLRLERDGASWKLIDFHGGSKRNAIPREATARVRVRGEMAARIPGLLTNYLGELKMLHVDSEADWSLEFEVDGTDQSAVIEDADARRLLGLLYTAPNGVITMSSTIPGLVESSCNLGVLDMDEHEFSVILCTRSSNAAALSLIPDQIAALAHAHGFVARQQAPYPGWQPDMGSPMLAITRQVFSDLAGADPEVTAIHAGLECGLLKRILPECDMISFGPDINNAHSPDEEVRIPSVGVVTRQVEALLRALCDR